MNLNIIKYLVELTPRKQIIAALLIGISSLTGVTMYEHNLYLKKVDSCNQDNIALRNQMTAMSREKDSMILVIQQKANDEVHDYLVKANQELKDQLSVINDLNNKRVIIYNKNKKIVNTNEKILKQLKDVQ